MNTLPPYQSSGLITSGDIADSLVMKKMDDNRGLMIIRDASHKHIQPLTLNLFSKGFNKNMVKYSSNFYIYVVLF